MMLRWVSSTPLGVPSLPLEKRMAAVSSGLARAAEQAEQQPRRQQAGDAEHQQRAQPADAGPQTFHRMQRHLRQGRGEVDPALFELAQEAVGGDDMANAGLLDARLQRLGAGGVVEIDDRLADHERGQIGDGPGAARGQQDADDRLRRQPPDLAREQQHGREQAPIGQGGADGVDDGHPSEVALGGHRARRGRGSAGSRHGSARRSPRVRPPPA